jgi:glycosyltransferase involved in cell wall biosynthesis
MTPPLVSILIPAFNSQQWIAETIRSALAQTWPRKEIVVVDDGSSDGTLQIARRFASPTLQVVTQPNQGAAAARNMAFAQCQGDYIQWLDADDLLAPDKIERQLAARKPSQLYSCAWGRFLKHPGKTRFTPTPLWYDLSPVDWMLKKMEHGVYMQTTAWLVGRELTQAAGPWDTRLCVDDDGEYFTRIILASHGVHFVPEARSYYRATGSGSLSQIGFSRGKMESQLLSLEWNIARLRAVEESERVRSACIAYLQKYLVYFDPENPDLIQRAQQLAESLGGKLSPPRLSWKYAWIQAVLGWRAAKKAQFHCSKVRGSILRALD